MTSAIRLQRFEGVERGYDTKIAATRPSYALRRAAVLSYEQLVAGPGLLRRVSRPVAVMPSPAPAIAQAPSAEQRVGVSSQALAEELAREPKAHPVAPDRPKGAAKPVYEIVSEPAEPVETEVAPMASPAEAVPGRKSESMVVEPVEPLAEPRHRGSLHGGNENPVRSMLSPSLRAALRRPETRLDRDGKSTYVTYTVDTTGKK